MNTQSAPPRKRSRASLSGNKPAECIREFKLPQQYPSMVPKDQSDTSFDRINNQTQMQKQSVHIAFACIPKPTIGPKFIEDREIVPVNTMRTIELKYKDGRHVGKVNIDDLPRNIQGKTITIAKNSLKKLPQVIPVTDACKGTTVGLLTPIDVLEPNDIIRLGLDRKRRADTLNEKNMTKNLASALSKNIGTSVALLSKPRVLVSPSGKGWQITKIPNAAQIGRNTKTCVVSKFQHATLGNKAAISWARLSQDEQNQNVHSANKICLGADSSVALLTNKTLSETVENCRILERSSESNVPDSTSDGTKPEFSVGKERTENARTKHKCKRTIRCSRIKSLKIGQAEEFKDKTAKFRTIRDTSGSTAPEDLQGGSAILGSDNKGSCTTVRAVAKNNPELTRNSGLMKKQVAQILSTTPETVVQSIDLSHNATSVRNNLSTCNNDEIDDNASSKDLLSLQKTEKIVAGPDGRIENLANNLSILEQALSTVEDDVLREKALKALAECGIGTERLVPVRPTSERKPVKDSNSQTFIFGLWDKEKFIYVQKDRPTIQRIRITPELPAPVFKNVPVNPNSQDAYINGIELPHPPSMEHIDLADMVEGYIKDNDAATKIAAIFDKSTFNIHQSPTAFEIFEQLEKDYNDCRKYDENGFLNIHKAVIANQIQAVFRHLMVLRACGESIDIPTQDGQTSLELAIRYNASPKIVKKILDSGAEPTSLESGHDSAVIIASRQSKTILMELVRYVKRHKLLDNFDSNGFTALHYCAQNGYKDGALALVCATADVNLRDRRSGRTPLFHSVENEHNGLAEVLLEKGAEVRIPNYAGQTIFNILDDVKHYSLLDVLNKGPK